MLKLASLLLSAPALLASGNHLSLKDTPPPRPALRAEAVPYLQIIGFHGRFEVPRWVLTKYRLSNGQYISPILARVIAEDLGVGYSPELRIILQQLDEKERRQ